MSIKIINKKTNLEVSVYDVALEMYKAGSNIIYCDIECVLQEKTDGTVYILDECGNWAYLDMEKYRIEEC